MDYDNDADSVLISPTAGRTAQATDEYLDSKLLVPEYGADPSLANSIKRAQEAGIPELSVSPQQGQFLSVLAKGMGATRILEIGTLYGWVLLSYISMPNPTATL